MCLSSLRSKFIQRISLRNDRSVMNVCVCVYVNLEYSFLPMSETCANLALIFELGALETRTVKVSPDLGDHFGRHNHGHVSAHVSSAHLPVMAHKRANYPFARLVHIRSSYFRTMKEKKLVKIWYKINVCVCMCVTCS